MAELIPIEYRIQGMQKKLIVRWGILASLMAVLCGGGIFYAYKWRNEQGKIHQQVAQVHQTKSLVIQEGMNTFKKLQELHDRMMKLDQLQNDEVLISMLTTTSDCMSPNDFINYISIDAHGISRGSPAATQSDVDYNYEMHLAGFTMDDKSHSALFHRLTQAGDPANGNSKVPFDVDFNSQMKTTEFLDGSLMQFKIDCHRPASAG